MPVSVITDIVTWAELIGQLLLTGTELYVLTYLVFGGGWLDMIRLISFWLDKILLKYIDQFYSYFEKILGGQIFAPDVVNDVMSRVYIFVSLFAVLKLLMLLMKYLISPELVSDDKVGTSALIKRVITGMCGMLFLPTIFDLALGVQKAVLNDNLFGKVLLSEDGVKEFEKYDTKIGRLLAFNVHQAFWSLDKNRVTDKNIQKKYDQAIKAMDPNVAGDINEKFNGDYAFDYFPIASSVVLVYVLYLVIKYCIDVVVRMFKLFLLQMMGPLAISDYMINGDSKEMFKNWLKTTISVYAMLFVRIFSIWFIAFVAVLMNKNCTTVGADGICEDSLLYISNGNTDYLLRGIIVLGLLAVLMDLPKFFSDLFGLDLEQDATVKGLMQKVGGAAKGVAMGGLAVGGAALGGAIAGAKGTISAGKGLASNLSQNKGKMDQKMKSNPQLAGKMADIENKKQSLKGLKGEERKAAKQELKDAKKDFKTASKNSEERKEYKAANARAISKAGVNAAASGRGIATGAFQGLAGVVPGLKDVAGGYNQGKGSVEQQDQARNKKLDEREAVGGSYKQGVDLAVNEIKLNREKLEFEGEAMVGSVKMDAARDAEMQIRGTVTSIDTNNAGPVQVAASANVTNVDASNAQPVQVSATANVSSVDSSDIGNVTINTEVKKENIDEE